MDGMLLRTESKTDLGNSAASRQEPLDPRSTALCGPQPTQNAFQALMQRARREHILYAVDWEMTHGCNLACVMCYNVPRPEPELSTDEGLALLDQIAEAGALELTLTGGEVLTRRDFFTL